MAWRPVKACPYVVHIGVVGYTPQMCNPTCDGGRNTDEIKKLLLHHIFAVPYGVEHFTNGDRRWDPQARTVDIAQPLSQKQQLRAGAAYDARHEESSDRNQTFREFSQTHPA